MKSIINVAMLLLSLFLLNACEGMSAVAKVALQQMPQKQIPISDIFPDDRMAQKLAVAASEGDLEKVDELIANGANPNAVGEHGVTVIGWLLYRPNIAGLKRLFEHGADPNAIWDKWDTQRGWEWSFMHLATELSPNIGVDYLQLALNMGGNQNLKVNSYRKYPIELAVNKRYLPAFATLCNAGADLNFRRANGQTLLLSAIRGWNYELAFFLLGQGVDTSYESGDYTWVAEFAHKNGIRPPWPDLWCVLIHEIHISSRKPTSDMWFWRCINFLEKKGMDFAIPADVEKLRPKILDTSPTAYELEIERLKMVEENIDAS